MSESGIASSLARLNPFSRAATDDDDRGEEIDTSTVAGGGHSGNLTDLKQHQLRVSHALKSFLVHEGVVSEEDAGLGSDEPGQAIRALINKKHISVPSYVTDRSHPLPEYFISSSHNTYLMAHQLYGVSSATAYRTALHTGSRCVEIDAWDNEDNHDEPKVTHGYTLVSNIPFRSVCMTIRDVVDEEAAEGPNNKGYKAAPVLLSLENHCSPHGQKRLVEIMKEVWGDRLLSEPVRQKGKEKQPDGEHVTLGELGSKIVVVVEYHLPNEPDDSSSSSSSSNSSDVEENEARLNYKEKKKSAPATVIIPELAELGVYAQSVKPADNTWFDPGELENGPHHHLINVSESGLAAHLPAESVKIARHNAQHLMRVYPKGTRVSSKNLNPVPFWGIGAQICALNWQTFGSGMQINDALFSGSDGYVLKPTPLRAGGDGVFDTVKKRLRLHVAGATDIPVPKDIELDDIKPYVTCTIVHPGDLENQPPKRKTVPYRRHKLGFLHKGENPPAIDPVWNETLEWEYDGNELAFLRVLIKNDDSFSRNTILAVAAMRVLYLVTGWSFVRMLDLKGRETKCLLLLKFDIENA
ncbi:putative 1-phosphatidylinositol-4,5-bisphosphate phosphodiesterase 1 [Lineolata rhizophorae]|uniref:Phosphoinositide phospholipase C n=1 Tax=Lineolata rhizophorae TaxID=578093 RepID=A0A6A6P5J0_9PEZI|nr:putative 1-phosphatidylinositol-4,5-bisphosphate phosphodiesterase 1 [Lineolata rhizophorae]